MYLYSIDKTAKFQHVDCINLAPVTCHFNNLQHQSIPARENEK